LSGTVRAGRSGVLVTGIVIRNFKSIENVEFDLHPGVNVLVGANASGKTNILEAISFLYKALIEAAERVPYRSHVPYYWDARDIIYERSVKAS
jgi:AAA15 family ATPase/GTPase